MWQALIPIAAQAIGNMYANRSKSGGGEDLGSGNLIKGSKALANPKSGAMGNLFSSLMGSGGGGGAEEGGDSGLGGMLGGLLGGGGQADGATSKRDMVLKLLMAQQNPVAQNPVQFSPYSMMGRN